MRLIEARVVAAFGIELEDDEPYDRAEIETELRAWMGQFGPVRELSLTDDVPAPAANEPEPQPQAPQRPPFRRPPPKIFRQAAAESEPPPPEVARALGALAPSVPVEGSAPAPGAFYEEDSPDAAGRARKRPAARKRRG